MQCNKECLHIIKHACISSPSQQLHNVRGPESTRTSLWRKYESAKLRGRTGAKKKRFDGEDAKMITKIEKSTFKAV